MTHLAPSARDSIILLAAIVTVAALIARGYWRTWRQKVAEQRETRRGKALRTIGKGGAK